jgi:hypothetical protein
LVGATREVGGEVMKSRTEKWMKLGLKIKLLRTLNQSIMGDLRELNIRKEYSSKLISVENKLDKIKSDLEDIMFKEKETINELDSLQVMIENARINNEEYDKLFVIHSTRGKVATNVFYGPDVIPGTELTMDISKGLRHLLEEEIEKMFQVRMNQIIDLVKLEVK